jgi:hypothetical protein
MNNINTKLFFFPLPQEVIINNNEAKIICNIVMMPKFDPTISLKDVAVAFAESTILLDAFLIKGTELLPSLINHNADYKLVEMVLPPLSPDRIGLFEQLKSFFKIDDGHGRQKMTAEPIKKYLPEAYQQAFGFAGTRQGAVTDDSYFCALKENKFAAPPDPAKRDKVNWSQVMAFCLHQPELARQLGLLYKRIEIQLPSADYYADGGWFYVDLNQQSSYRDLLPEDLQRYAAWIPPITESRKLFSPVLFPVEEAPAAITLDDVFDEVSRYSDGYAKIVHASQAVTTDHLSEAANGTAPVTDMGIRLAWDDEQVLEWYNRGFRSQEKTQVAAGISDTPLMVSRYRVDVAVVEGDDVSLDSDALEKKLKEANAWKSQVSVTADEVKAGNINLGAVKDEFGVQVSPAKHGDAGNYWLPAYFANWNGTSLCLPDPLPEKINQLDDIKQELLKKKNENEEIPPVLYGQPAEDKVELKYGSAYAFRVRLSDLSGGGPGADSNSINRGEHKIAVQKFKRYVAPQPPSVSLTADLQTLRIERPRLNYPAILFTGESSRDAITELLADREQLIQFRSDHANTKNRKWLREVSLPDPDVLQAEIVVEVRSLDMDREDSYHAIKKISPKEPFVLLYKTLRNFPAYQLKHDRPDDAINLALSYQEIALIHFLAPDEDLGFGDELHNAEGPLLLPTAREVQLTIRSFCPAENIDYFGNEETRTSIPYILSLRQDPVKLEDANLFIEPKDPLLSLFFQPEKAITPQLRQEQKLSGKGAEMETDLLDNLASVTGLINKKGTLTGPDNVRIQFGCSVLLNHSLAPDSSSLYFASRHDFYHKWINVIQLKLNRDWTWDLLKPDAFTVFRQWRFEGEVDLRPKEIVGKISLSKGLNWQAMKEPDRSFTHIVFVDALDPKPAAGEFPEPVDVRYFIQPNFRQSKIEGVFVNLEFDEALTTKTITTLLPITTVPAQVPKIVSVGLALSPDSSDEALIATRYVETASRNRYLWIEFDQPLADPKDAYFARVVAYAPDPMLAALPPLLKDVRIAGNEILGDMTFFEAWKNYLLTEQTEPPLNIDPEILRIVRPLQPFDGSGLDAMQVMTPADTTGGEQARHFLLPLPPGVYPDSEELFGFFTYEFRVGHQHPKKWSTAQGRYGSPIRVTGVQHPAPPMLVSTLRNRDKVMVTTRHAQSFFNGGNLTPAVPRTDIYACLYAQVLQADGVHYRNILIDQIALLKPLFTDDAAKLAVYEDRKKIQEDGDQPFTPPEAPVLLPGTPPRAVGFWNLKTIREKLRFIGISDNASLSVLTIELMPPNDFHGNELRDANFQLKPPLPPQELSLDKIRILRTSKLCAVRESCAVVE